MITARPDDGRDTSAIPIPPDRGHLVYPPEQLRGLMMKRRGGRIPGSDSARRAGDIFEVLSHELLRFRIAALNHRLADPGW